MNFIMNGGPIFMVPLVILLIIILILFVKSIKNNSEKNRKLINSLGLFSFVFGVLGFIVGLIGALEIISLSNNTVSPQVLAAGFKIGLIPPTFGTIIFLIGKLFGIILTSKNN